MQSSHTSTLQCTTQPRGNGSRYRAGIPPQGAARDMATRGDPSPGISASEEDPVSRWGARTSWRGSIGTSSTKFSSIESSSRECATCVVEISRTNRSKIFLFPHSPLSSNHPHRRWNPKSPIAYFTFGSSDSLARSRHPTIKSNEGRCAGRWSPVHIEVGIRGTLEAFDEVGKQGMTVVNYLILSTSRFFDRHLRTDCSD